MFQDLFSVRGSARARRRGTERRRVAEFIETLEVRTLLSATVLQPSQVTATPSVQPLASQAASAGVTNTTPQGYTPSQIQQAYGFNGITFSNGTIQGNGAGQTIAIVDAYNDPNLASDLHTFDQEFGLSDPSLSIVGQTGGAVPSGVDAGWAMEEALDVEWAHAMAPGAKILVVEANSSSLSDLLTAVNTARNAAGVSVVSMSWGSSEFMGETQYDSYFTTPAGHTPVTFVAASGDVSAATTWPAVSPNVLSVGGTALTLSAANTISSETGWSDTGGGLSSFEKEPSYQTSVQNTGARTSPDVAYDANPNTGFAVYDSIPYSGQSGWFEVGGTSAGAPQWAALVAIADQGRAIAGQPAISNAASAVYGLPSGDFHDITSGSNGYSATTGYDLVTGLGTPNAALVVNGLVGTTTATQTTTTTTTQSQVTTNHTHRHDMTTQPPSTNPTSPTSPSSPAAFIIVSSSPAAPFGAAGTPTVSVSTQIASASGAPAPAMTSVTTLNDSIRARTEIRDVNFAVGTASLFATTAEEASPVVQEIRSSETTNNEALGVGSDALESEILFTTRDLLMKVWSTAKFSGSTIGDSESSDDALLAVPVELGRVALPDPANNTGESLSQQGWMMLVSGLIAGGFGVWSVRRKGWAAQCVSYVRHPFSRNKRRPHGPRMSD